MAVYIFTVIFPSETVFVNFCISVKSIFRKTSIVLIFSTKRVLKLRLKKATHPLNRLRIVLSVHQNKKLKFWGVRNKRICI